MRIKGSLAKGSVAALVLTLVPLVAFSAQKVTPGSPCKVLNKKVVNQNKTYTCVKSGKKLVWNKGVAIKKPTATPSPSPAPTVTVTATPSPAPTVTVTATPSPAPTVTVTATPSPAPTVTVTATPSPAPMVTVTATPSPTPTPTLDLQKIVLQWTQVSTELSDPGTLLDPDLNLLQDNGLNSSFVVQALNDGTPIQGIEIKWASDDNSSNIQAFANKTDSSGRARIWYISGKSQTQSVSATISGGSSSVVMALTRKSTILKTVGRPVVVGFVPDTSKNYNQVKIQGTLNTDPVGTYYAFANFSNFYTGVQRVLCNGWDMYSQICSDSRGGYKGREAQFSVWDGKDSTGRVINPVVIDKSNLTKCSPFDHEGSGQMCFIAFDWLPGDKVEINIEKLSGAPLNYERLRVTGQNLSSGFTSHFATIDVPGGVKLNTEFASFNEHYLIESASNCFEVENRSFTINKVEFIDGGQSFVPIRSYAYGNEVASGQSLCQNYGFINSVDGLEIFSGGTSRFVDIKQALAIVSGRSQFSSTHQAKIMNRDIPLGALGR
jgi:hypothetical protein